MQLELFRLAGKGTGAGGANRDRTGDLLLAKQALSQLSYGPAADAFAEVRKAGRRRQAKNRRVAGSP